MQIHHHICCLISGEADRGHTSVGPAFLNHGPDQISTLVVANQQRADKVRSFRPAIGMLAVAIGAGLLENGGSAFGILLFQRILPHPGNGPPPVNNLCLRRPAAQP